MKYIKIRFTFGIECDAYQEIDTNGNYVVNYKDLDGNVMTLPEVTESMVIDATPPFPEWGITDE